jgi:hypothetical protein
MVFLFEPLKPKTYTDFPEDIFAIEKNKEALYKYKIKAGQETCKQKTIIFCGICRNVGEVLERNILRLHRTGKMFKDYHIFLYENDSSDNTVAILNKYKSDKLHFISTTRDDKNYRQDLDNGKDTWHYNRCKILAECRNYYMDYMKDLDYDLACMVDIDLKGGWSYEGINHGVYTLFSDEANACVSSYGVLTEKTNTLTLEESDKSQYLMYDSFAFRPVGVESLHLLRTPSYNYIVLNRGDDPIKVWSNFGGMAIYKKSLINNLRYGAKEWKTGYVDPDHVVFHRELSKLKYNIILDPSMIVSYSNHKYST